MDNYREKIVRIVERELNRTEEYQQRRDEYGNEEYILGCIMVKGDAFPKGVIAHAFVEDMGLELQFQVWRDEPRIRQKQAMWYDLTLFDVEGDFFGKLEQGYSILSVSDLFHCTAWNATEYLADEQNRDKENSCWKGMQRYLNYKKRAEQMLMEERRKYANAKAGDDVLFADFMEQWLEIVKSTVSIPTYSSYVNAVKSIIAPYFRKKKILLRDLQAHDIQMFYQEQLQRVKASSVIHYHANIHKALKYAVKNDMIPSNPADKVERPKQDKFYGNFYDRDELNKLFEAVAGTKLELPVLLGAFYGLRRSEIVGLKWSAIDFEQNTITISHTVTSCNLDGKCVIVAKDTTKTKSSRRTLPLVPYFHEKLLAVKAQQGRNQKLCGRSYNREFLEYICVDDIGDRFKPNYITSQFPRLLERNGFRKIRFHDLRHSCASLLLASGVPMKHIQEWLGHSDFSTTANIYAHLDYSSKLTSASAMESNFHLGV